MNPNKNKSKRNKSPKFLLDWEINFITLIKNDRDLDYTIKNKEFIKELLSDIKNLLLKII